MTKINPFHLAVPVYDLDETRHFYREVIGCEEGRSSEHWVDFNLFGHQFVIHLQARPDIVHTQSNPVDGHHIPVPHFGVVLDWEDWEALAERLRVKGVHFVIEPYIRFKGQVGEQGTMFFLDPSGNALEFKSFKDMNMIFAK